MRNILIIFILLIFNSSHLLSQQFDYGNIWYKSNPTRSFIKLVVEEDGVYRVTSADLQAAGYDLSSVNANNLQLLYRGRQVPMFVSKDNAGQLARIEFVGVRNDGRIDSIMYRDPISGRHKPDLQPNKNISLFSDESAYFLTWSNEPGRRYINVFDVLYTNYTPEPYFTYTSLIEYTNTNGRYILGGGGAFNSFFTLNSDYVTGEGYHGPDIQLQRPIIVEVPTPGAVNNPERNIRVKARIFNRSDTQHILKIELNGDESNPVLDTALASNRIFIKTYTRDINTELSDVTDLKFFALKSPTDNNQLSWTSITYDRSLTLSRDSLIRITDYDKNTPTYFQFRNLSGSDTLFVYDLKDPIRAKGLISNQGETGNIIIPAVSGKRDLLMVTDKGIKKPRIVAHSLNRLFDPAAGAEFVIITHRDLSSSAEAYARYRDTATVNPVSVKLVYTDEIYDEYGYGTITSWAIKRFCKDALDNWQVKPKYFFLWGKGTIITRNEIRLKVPTFGYPATDHEYISHFNQNSTDINPEAAIGRVNINNNEEGFNYLDKVDEYEHTPWESWMKTGIFLGGGGNALEQNSIGSTFEDLLNVFQDAPYGGRGVYFQKTSASLADPTTASYHDEISGGSSIIHFFGHSTANIQDIAIREANEYNNLGRFPLMVAMGCYGGNFTGSSSFGERWVIARDRGCIGYLGNSSAGYLPPLSRYASVLYDIQYREGLGLPIGETIRRSLDLFTDSLNSLLNRNHGRQLNLQGDPAIILYNVDLPDYSISEPDIFFNPGNFTAQDDSFELNIIVKNSGIATRDSFTIGIEQRFPNGTIYTHPSITVPSTSFIDTFSTTLRNPAQNEITGQNIFDIFVDAQETISELDEQNNRILLNRLIPGNKPAPLYPSEYAIIGNSQTRLDASAFFMTQDTDVGFIFEIDTLPDFSSSLKTSSGIQRGNANYISWDVPFTLEDSAVYYWRVRLSDISPSIWSNSSFTYIPNKIGWSQSTLAQISENRTEDLAINNFQNRWEFESISRDFEFRTRLGGTFTLIANNGSYVLDFATEGISGNGIAYAVIEENVEQYTPETPLEVRYASTSDFYIIRNTILNMKDGEYIMLASNRNPRVHTWTEDIFETLRIIGISDNIRYLNDGDGFVLLGRKGFPNSAEEVLTLNAGNQYVMKKEFISPKSRGNIFSSTIGPVMNWDKIEWNVKSLDRIVDEATQLTVYASDYFERDSLLFEVDSDLDDILLSDLNASTYPFLKFELNLQDSLNRTPPQLDFWRIYYDPVPDAVVDPVTDFSFESDTIDEGQDVSIRMLTRNVTTVNMDSLLVKFFLAKQDRSQIILDSLRVAPLGGNNTVEIDYTFNTLNKELEGNTSLIVNINPDNDQPEQHSFNNTYIQPFFVQVDESNPILDVTFDGKHIINGDIVSSNPEILVQVNDENAYIPVTDSNSVELYLRKGNIANGFERIFFSDPRIEWQEAELPENKARLFFYPGRNQELEDDEYTLRVQARDQRGNVSGRNDSFYEISFEVVSETAITNVLNYPNPFSTSTRFVYTLTGSELPEVFQIQIYSVSGRQIKVIDLVELGDAKIGRHITEYSWDGTDEFGDRLDNGVYLYRAVIKMPNEELLHREESIDQYFKNGWGKMYILR